MTISAYPLQWPAGWKRTQPTWRKAAQFKSYKRALSIADGVQRVRDELARIGIGDADLVISTNIELRLDGWPRSDRAEPLDPGVCVYWRVGKVDRCMAVDRYDRAADNLAAIAATLEAMRAIERHGGAEILDRAFTGFVALPAPEVFDAMEVLGLQPGASRVAVEDAYRRLRSQHHPDRGGDPAAFQRVQRAYEEAVAG